MDFSLGNSYMMGKNNRRVWENPYPSVFNIKTAGLKAIIFTMNYTSSPHRAVVQSQERYLASGAIKGIGVTLAGRIIKKFQKETFHIIEEEPERLSEVKGISEKLAREIYGIFFHYLIHLFPILLINLYCKIICNSILL